VFTFHDLSSFFLLKIIVTVEMMYFESHDRQLVGYGAWGLESTNLCLYSEPRFILNLLIVAVFPNTTNLSGP